MDWWMVAHTPSGSHCWQLGDPDAATSDDQVTRAKTLLAFPGGDGWAADPSLGWHLQVSPGRPHDNLLALCQMRQVSELGRVAASAVQSWRDADAQARRTVDLAAARAATARLTDADRAVLRAELSGAPTPKPTGGR